LIVTGTFIDDTPPPHTTTLGARAYELCTGVPDNNDFCINSIRMNGIIPPENPMFAAGEPDRVEADQGRNSIQTFRLRALRPGTTVLSFAVNGELVSPDGMSSMTYGSSSQTITVIP